MDEHVLQAAPNYCVPACIVMVEIWRGQTPNDARERQRVLFERFGVGGLCSLPSLHGVVGQWLEWFDVVNEPDVLDVFAATLDDDSWALVNCLSGGFARWLRASRLESPHGELPGGPLPYHALCVTGREGRAFRILDPWTAREHQPLLLSFEDFAEIWTGHALLVTRGG